MLGLALYWLVSLGLGGFVYRFLVREPTMPGIAFGVGAMLPMLVYPVLHLYAGLSLTSAAYLTIGLAVVGCILWALDFRGMTARSVFHPMLALPAVTVFVVLVLGQGRLDYLPYTTDEFSNWIGISRNIFLLGDYASIRNDLWLHGYTPGWRLWMLFPWMLAGEIDYGLSATAPFFMHLGAACILFDIVRRAVSDRYTDDAWLPLIGAWIVVGLLLAGEGMGKLWSYTLLIEPPQIYAAMVLLGLVMAMELRQLKSTWPVLLAIGLAAAAGYFVKSAGLLFVAAVGGAFVLHYWRAGKLFSRESVVGLLLVTGPGLLMHVVWSSGVSASDSCIVSPVSTLLAGGGHSQGLAIWDTLAYRFVEQTGGYVLTYKWPLTLVATIGWGYALVTGHWRAFAMLALFSLAYFTALYVFHLVCFGPYYFETLNSIPRFTRVALQPFQAIGFIWAALMGFKVLQHLAAGRSVTARLHKPALLCGGIVVAILGAYQAYQLDLSRRDVTTRVLQNVDPRIAEAHALVMAVRKHALPPLDQTANVFVLDQGGDQTLTYYAFYFASRVVNGRIKWFVRFDGSLSWTMPADTSEPNARAVIDAFQSEARRADIIWPLKMDTWQIEALSTIIGPDCDFGSGEYFAYKADVPAPFPLICTRKPPNVATWSPVIE